MGLCIGLAIAATSSACRPRQSLAPGKALPGIDSRCTDNAAYVDGPYKYENNQWGRDKARSRGDFEQCLLRRTIGDKHEYGWTWNWPGHEPSVYAYPEIIWGWKPWTGGTSSDGRFPRRVSEIEQLKLHYHVETDATGSYNLAPEVWLTSGKGGSGKPNPELITTEIMFWLEYAGAARPAGDVIDTPTIDGVRYELWKMDDMGNKGGGVGWRIYSLKSPQVTRQGTLNIGALLRDMTAKGQINAKDYVASVEFGNEINGGSGTTWVKRFEIEAQP